MYDVLYIYIYSHYIFSLYIFTIYSYGIYIISLYMLTMYAERVHKLKCLQIADRKDGFMQYGNMMGAPCAGSTAAAVWCSIPLYQWSVQYAQRSSDRTAVYGLSPRTQQQLELAHSSQNQARVTHTSDLQAIGYAFFRLHCSVRGGGSACHAI